MRRTGTVGGRMIDMQGRGTWTVSELYRSVSDCACGYFNIVSIHLRDFVILVWLPPIPLISSTAGAGRPQGSRQVSSVRATGVRCAGQIVRIGL